MRFPLEVACERHFGRQGRQQTAKAFLARCGASNGMPCPLHAILATREMCEAAYPHHATNEPRDMTYALLMLSLFYLLHSVSPKP